MLSIEGFVKHLRDDYISEGTPFIAYWHPRGFSVMRTKEMFLEEYDITINENGKIHTEHAMNRLERDRIVSNNQKWFHEIVSVDVKRKPCKVKKSTVSAMRKVIAQLRKGLSYSMYVIEFDGNALFKEGPDLDVLSELEVTQ